MILVKKFAKSFECPEFTEEPILVLFLNQFLNKYSIFIDDNLFYIRIQLKKSF